MMSLLLDRGRRTVAIAVTFLSVLVLTVSLFPLDSARATGHVSAGPAAATSIAETAGPVKAADLSQFRPGNIVSDAVFFDRNTMTEAQIQTFLEQKVPKCESGYTCLKDWHDTSRTTSADAMCGAYAGGTRERASRIIYKVAQACGINPQVILVTLQKEQGLVTHVWPSDWRYRAAMGQGCPDTAACDSRYYGFFNQVYGAAWQMKRYANPPGTSQYFTWYAPGKTWNILYNPNRNCGSTPVLVENQATANLYYYTPYQPNAAALRAGYGTGDGCSAYGNRNFFNYFTDWFGSTQTAADPCRQPESSAVTAAGGEFVVNVAQLNARRAPTTDCNPTVRSFSQGTTLTRLGTYGDWWLVRLDGLTYWVHGSYLVSAPSVSFSTTRLAGPDRYATAVEVSRAAFPSGARTVFLASGEEFPDALAAGAAAGHNDSSLLLTAAAALPEIVRSELIRLAPTRVILVGGDDRVSPEVAAAVATAVPRAAIDRVAGADRFETSRLIASQFFPSTSGAYIVTGLGFADAVVASGLGGARGIPVVLVNGASSSPDDATVATLRAVGATNLTIAGSTPSVSAEMEGALRSAGFAVQRFGGGDRYETSKLLTAAAYPNGASRAIVATGAVFPDALTGAVLAAQLNVPLVTAPPACMPGATKDWLRASKVSQLTLIGGLPSLSEAVQRGERC